MNGRRCALVLRDDSWRCTWAYLIRKKSDIPRAFGGFLADTWSGGNVEALRTDPGGEFTSDRFLAICDHNRIRREITNAGVSALNVVVGRGVAIADTMQNAARIRAYIRFTGSGVSESTDSLWGIAFRRVVDCMNRSSTISNPESGSPFRRYYQNSPQWNY